MLGERVLLQHHTLSTTREGTMHIHLSILVSVLGLCIGVAQAGSLETKKWGNPVTAAQLDAQRGGTDTSPVTINTNMLNAKLFDNSAIGNVTGNNTITEGAFSGASGLPTVIQNSGNNVIIQNGTVLNLTVK
jgi:hypothetical protein